MQETMDQYHQETQDQISELNSTIQEYHPAIDCEWQPWSTWGDCSKPCGGGERQKTRSVRVQEQHGGAVCSGNNTEKESCNNHPCPRVVNCAWGPWQAWEPCSKTCGGGISKRRRAVKVQAENGGSSCVGHHQETKNC